MKNKFILGLLVLFPVISFSSVKIEIEHSEAASYLHFVRTGFQEPFTSGSVKEIIGEADEFKDEETIRSYNFYRSFLTHGYNFDDEVKSRPEGFWAEDAINVLAASSKNIESFERQLSVLLPYRGINSYFKVKNKIYPLFQEKIWKPSLKSLASESKKTEAILKETEFQDWLNKAKAFYRSDYPEDLSFKVALVPVPDADIKNRHTSAENLRDVQVVPYLVSEGVKESLDVIFHEFCHALYEGQSNKTKMEINDFFLKSNDSHSLFLYRYLNEAMATAWGNGWYYEILNGKLSEKSWYNVNYIDGLAKELLPLIKSTVNEKSQLNKDFLNKALQLSKKIYPEGPWELDPNFMSIKLHSDHKKIEGRVFKKEFKKNFRIQSMHNSSPTRKEDWNNFNVKGVSNTVYITSDRNKGFEKFSKYFDMSAIQPKLVGKSHFWTIIPHNGNYYFWINTGSLSSFQKLMKKFKKLKLLPKESTVITL